MPGSGSRPFPDGEFLTPSGRFESLSRRRRRRRVRNLAFLPSLLTFGNGIAGLGAIVSLARAFTELHPENKDLEAAGTHMAEACLMIGLGMVFDMLDGKVARLTGTAGKFGAELDSLCDVVTFGVAPAFFLRVFGEATFGTGIEATPDIASRALWGCSALYLVAVLFRLARFNVESASDQGHNTFRGLPSPAGAGGVISLFLIGWYTMGPQDGEIPHSEFYRWLIPAFGLTIAALMVSRIKYQHVFNRLFTGGRSVQFVMLTIAVLIGIYIVREHFVPVLAGAFLLYILSGPVFWVINRGRRGAGRSVAVPAVPGAGEAAVTDGRSGRMRPISGASQRRKPGE